MPRIVCISDTHNRHDQIQIPDGDILIHAGDMTGRGRVGEVGAFAHWFRNQPHEHKICIAGNHDFLFQQDPGTARSFFPHDDDDSLVYLENSWVKVHGLTIWGTPWTPEFHNWAFNGAREDEPWSNYPPLKPIFDGIDEQANIIVSHGPPYGILDKIDFPNPGEDEHRGSKELLSRCNELPHLRLVVCGHIHEGYGMIERAGVTYVNASSLNLRYEPVNPAVVIDL